MSTGIAIAGFVERAKIAGEFVALYVNAAVTRVQCAVSPNARRADAIERVGAVFNTSKNIVWFRNANHVTWFVYRKLFVHPADNFADAIFLQSATKTVAVKVHCP